jgi:hypothetical protein
MLISLLFKGKNSPCLYRIPQAANNHPSFPFLTTVSKQQKKKPLLTKPPWLVVRDKRKSIWIKNNSRLKNNWNSIRNWNFANRNKITLYQQLKCLQWVSSLKEEHLVLYSHKLRMNFRDLRILYHPQRT